MPVYEYRCLDCGKELSIALSISEHDKGDAKCPECGGQSPEAISINQ